MTANHTVTSYEQELGQLRGLVSRMGDLAVKQFTLVIEAMVQASPELAKRVIEGEPEADRLEHQVEMLVLRVLALRQPAAVDLRDVLAALRIANELERICDHAENTAERLIALRAGPVQAVPAPVRIGEFAVAMLRDVMDAYNRRDAEKARSVWNRDEELDAMYSSFVRELLTHMMEDVRRISIATHFLFIARDLERVGDRATNIAEMVHFLVEGALGDEDRRKADVTRSMFVPVPTEAGEI